MKKKILCLAMTVIMAAGVHTTAFAKDYQGADGWQVHFTGDKMESNFENCLRRNSRCWCPCLKA